ncbi:MAG: hypothetical protein WAV32_06070 [Halobacteriota archaeon]
MKYKITGDNLQLVTIELSVAFQRRLGSAFFGGEGFILERLAETFGNR